jgi:hypothetical protein
MFDGDPGDVVAIVVGVDHYQNSDQWGLVGPARDALSTVDWLLGHRVPAQNITLFLSPESLEAEDIRDRTAPLPRQNVKSAVHQALDEYLNRMLPNLRAKALLVHWGGHGVVDDLNRHQYLYTADAEKRFPYCVCAETLVEGLSGQRYRHLRQQVFVFDACANQDRLSGGAVKPRPIELFGTGTRDASIRQLVLYGASLGNTASNPTEHGRERGLFSSLLFEELPRHGAPGIDQFMGAFNALKVNPAHHRLHEQAPMMIEPGQRGLPRPVAPHPPAGQLSPRAQALLDLINACQATQPGLLTHARLRRLYLNARPPTDFRRPTGETASWLVDLEDMRPDVDGQAPPLVEFAERLGREVAAPELQAWAQQQCQPGQYATLQCRLEDAADAERTGTMTLFIEVATENAPSFDWWLEGPDRRQMHRQSVAVDGSGVRSALVRNLPDMLLEAEACAGSAFDIRIGFIVPAGELLSGLESMVVQPADEDLAPAALNKQYTVLLHWSERQLRRNLRSANRWGRLVKAVEKRVASGGGAAVAWLEDGDPADTARYERAVGTLQAGAEQPLSLGIEHAKGAHASIKLDTVRRCLKEGVPCLFWLQRPELAADAHVLRNRIADAFARHLPDKAPLLFLSDQRKATREEQLGVDSIVWDLPRYLPGHHMNPPLFEDHQP